MKPFEQIISGGQTGVDIAALSTAHAYGIPTGGWMPKGWTTLVGPMSGYADLYGMRQHPLRGYAPRTHKNVADAHATLRIARDWQSPGELCTLRAIGDAGRPHYDVHPKSEINGVYWWICGLSHPHRHGLVLNIAGNSERTAPGIEREASEFLATLFEAFGYRRQGPQEAP